MKTLDRRVAALEGPKVGTFDHLSDEELYQHLVAVSEKLVRAGVALPDDWREIVAGNDCKAIDRMREIVRRATLTDD